MKYLHAMFCLLLTLSLTGCNDWNSSSVTQTDLVNAQMYFDFSLEDTLKKAKKLEDPYDAYSLIFNKPFGVDETVTKVYYQTPSKAIIEHFNLSVKNDTLSSGTEYIDLTNKTLAIQTMFKYLDIALSAGDKRAFTELYGSDSPYFKYDTPSSSVDRQVIVSAKMLQAKHRDNLANLAESLIVKTPIDEDIIMAYAYQLEQGFVYPKNTLKSAAYYQKLYPDNNLIPLYLIELYLDINDYENAYFWKVRCIGDCDTLSRTSGNGIVTTLGLTSLFQSELNGEQFKAIEVAANDPKRKTFK